MICLGDFNLYLKSLDITVHNVFCVLCAETHTSTNFISLPFISRTSLSSECLDINYQIVMALDSEVDGEAEFKGLTEVCMLWESKQRTTRIP